MSRGKAGMGREWRGGSGKRGRGYNCGSINERERQEDEAERRLAKRESEVASDD